MIFSENRVPLFGIMLMKEGTLMTQHDENRQLVPRPADEDAPGWGIPIGIAAVALVAGVIIFSAAGPERTRTAQTNLNPSTTASQPAQPAESAIPPANAPAKESAPSMAPQKSNPAGTQ
jgi:hypothetical protein